MPASLPMCCEHCHKSPRCCHTACTTGTFYSFILGLLPAGWAAAPAVCLHQKPILQFLSESIGPLPGNGGTPFILGILERSLKYLRRCLKHRSDPPCYSPRPSQPPVKEITLQSDAPGWCVEHRVFSQGMHSGHKRHSRVRERHCCSVMLSAVRAPDPRAAPLALGIQTWAKDLSTWCAKDSAAAPKVATSVQSSKVLMFLSRYLSFPPHPDETPTRSAVWDLLVQPGDPWEGRGGFVTPHRDTSPVSSLLMSSAGGTAAVPWTGMLVARYSELQHDGIKWDRTTQSLSSMAEARVPIYLLCSSAQIGT